MKTIALKLSRFFFFPLLFFMLYSPTAFGQSILESLGGAPTKLTIHSRDTPQLDVVAQQLIRRGVSHVETDAILEFGAGYAHEVIHWELLTRQKIQTIKHRKTYGKDERYYELSFLDEEGKLIVFARMPEGRVRWTQSKNSDYVIYSFNLENLPVVIFEQARSLKLEYIHKSRKH